MIPSDSITFNDDDTAWLVTPSVQYHSNGCNWTPSTEGDCRCKGRTGADLTWELADRPCDTCGSDKVLSLGCWNFTPCPDCIDGRHTFTIDTYCEQQCDVYPCQWKHNSTCSGGTRTLRVSIIPGMVLPITTDDPICGGEAHIVVHSDDFSFLCDGPSQFHEPVTLPPAAAPGMWGAVKLRVDRAVRTAE